MSAIQNSSFVSIQNIMSNGQLKVCAISLKWVEHLNSQIAN
jgi:hypothetical protein